MDRVLDPGRYWNFLRESVFQNGGELFPLGFAHRFAGHIYNVLQLFIYYIVADVDETDIGAIRLHQPVMITADAFPGRAFTGKVTRIAPQGKVEESITIFKVKLEILGSGKDILKPMMTANVDIINEKLIDVVYVAREAVSETNGKKVAAILENGLPKEIPITTGIQNPIHVQVVSGRYRPPASSNLILKWK